MKPVAEIRRQNLELLVGELTTLESVAEKAGTSAVYLSQVRNQTKDPKTGKPRQMGSAIARRLEAGCGKQSGWMDTSHELSELVPAPPLGGMSRVPIMGIVFGKDGLVDVADITRGTGEALELVEFPTPDAKAYALKVRGDWAHPRYRAGEVLVIEPSVEPREGDDVLVTLLSGHKLLKQLNWIRNGDIQLLELTGGYAPTTLQLSEVSKIELIGGRARPVVHRIG